MTLHFRHFGAATRALLCGLALMFSMAVPSRADDAANLAAALRQSASGDWAGAARTASGLGRDIIEWQRLRAAEGDLGDYEAFLARHADWPGLALLREKGEEAVARSTNPQRVLAYFAAAGPETGPGAVAQVRAHVQMGQAGAAEDAAMRAWANLPFTAAEEAALLALTPEPLALVHEVRLDRLLWQGRRAEALRMIPRVDAGWKALAQARIALRSQASGTTALINAVPAARAADPGLAHERFLWRMRADLYDEALDLLLQSSGSAASLGDPAAWADRRAILARWLMRQGRTAEAYRAAADHHLTAGTDYADLEFLAGFLALRKRDDPATALRHFQRLQAAVSTPISLARAQYWQGRAQEAAGQADAAQQSFGAAARHHTAYYGLLAAERLGQPLSSGLLSDQRPAEWRTAAFAGSSVFQAAQLLVGAGERNLAKRFLLHLAEGLTPVELDQLGDFALSQAEPHLALLVAKAAAEQGVILPRAYFPVPDFVPEGLAVSRALALAIARRESEFDPTARSTADARGLMQVLPGTAKQMASQLGLDFAAGRLTSDPAYNVRLGAAYLARMAEEFGPSIALIASGYNAGPGRPRRWITEFGDPRRADVDIVDWVETIPFAETRTYVMRVVEGVVIYRAKLRGQTGPVRVSDELKG